MGIFDYLQNTITGNKQTPGAPTYQPSAFRKKQPYPGTTPAPLGKVSATPTQYAPVPQIAQQTPMETYTANRPLGKVAATSGTQATTTTPATTTTESAFKDIPSELAHLTEKERSDMFTKFGMNYGDWSSDIQTNKMIADAEEKKIDDGSETEAQMLARGGGQGMVNPLAPPPQKTDFEKAMELYQSNLLKNMTPGSQFVDENRGVYEQQLAAGLRGESPAIDRARKGAERDDAMAEYESINAAKSAAVRAGYEPGSAQYNEAVRDAQNQASAFRQKSMRGINDMRLTQQKEAQEDFRGERTYGDARTDKAQSDVRSERAYQDLKKVNDKQGIDSYIGVFKDQKTIQALTQAKADSGGDPAKFQQLVRDRNIITQAGEIVSPGASESVNATKAALDEFASSKYFYPKGHAKEGQPMSWDEAYKARLVEPNDQIEAQAYVKSVIDVTRQGVKAGQDAIDKQEKIIGRIDDAIASKDVTKILLDDWDEVYNDSERKQKIRVALGVIDYHTMPNPDVLATQASVGKIIEKGGKFYKITKIQPWDAGSEYTAMGYRKYGRDWAMAVPVEGGPEIQLEGGAKYEKG